LGTPRQSGWNYHLKADPAKVTRYRVRFKGQTVISHQGRVYEMYTGGLGGKEKWMRYIETLEGCEELV
jgi:hypothetical protein